MPKQTIEVDLPDGYEPTGEVRPPKVGDHYLNYWREVHLSDRDFYADQYRVIVRPVWKWPEWLKAPYIAMDSDGLWWAFAVKPMPEFGCWQANGRPYMRLKNEFTDFTPPPVDDWRQSLRKNPNH